ncbi:MAG TPA: enoyl-CoA hydratase/isomerase family protein [Alphaproteobacteria bacterium]
MFLNDLVIDRSAGIVHVTLNRPAALNALNVAMIDGLLPILQGDDTVLVTGAGGKAFCAGGDVKAVWQTLKDGKGAEAATDYFRHEYRMNAALFAHKAPYISYLNGITMGGGYGVSAHGSHLIACEATSFAMPEVKIGFFPDVGVMYHLARVPHQLGTYLALTGNTINAADMVYAGLAHAYVPLAQFEAFKAALKNGVGEAIKVFSTEPPKDGFLKSHQDIIEKCFTFEAVEEIIEALKVDGSIFAIQTASEIESRCPLSVKVALRHLRLSARNDFETVIARDLFLAHRFMESPNFMEGIRAALIDRDRSPRWNPASLQGVDDALLAIYFPSGGD